MVFDATVQKKSSGLLSLLLVPGRVRVEMKATMLPSSEIAGSRLSSAKNGRAVLEPGDGAGLPGGAGGRDGRPAGGGKGPGGGGGAGPPAEAGVGLKFPPRGEARETC